MHYQNLLLQHFEPHRLTDVVDEADLLHRVLPGGSLLARVEKLCLKHSVFQRGRYGMRVVIDGAMSSGAITVGIITGKPAGTMINGFDCPPLSLQLYAEDSAVSYTAAPENCWAGLVIQRERIQHLAVRLFGRPLPIPKRDAVRIQTSETDGRRIAATIDALFALAGYPDPGPAIEIMASQLEEQFIHDLASALNASSEAKQGREARRVAQVQGLMRRAEAYLDAHLTEPYSLSGLAGEMGVSHRSLQQQFRKVYGVTPQTWFRSMKLNALREELKRSGGSEERISDTAMRWGFLHLGRFAGDYRRLFGERPRDTARSS